MKLNHVAIWVKDLESMKNFYCTFLGGISNELYHNREKGFKSYFISFGDFRIELMTTSNTLQINNISYGYAHLAFSLGSKEKVNKLTQELALAGYTTSAARETGDGYYESSLLDPENNLIEITL